MCDLKFVSKNVNSCFSENSLDRKRDHISLLVGTPRCRPRRAAGGDRGDGGLGISATKTPISDGN